jgi:hypothetical protein
MVRAVAIWLGLLLCWSGAARADKPKIAVLGLEVAPGPGGAVDPGAQLIARELTKELRQRVLSPVCPFAMAPNSSKELLDEKLLMSCENEAADCMVVISAGLASDALLYGHVDKRGEGFHISLKLLDVKRKAIQSATDDLPAAGGIPGLSRRLYRRLIGDGPGASGTLIVKARGDAGAVRGGNVIIDDEDRGQLVGGKLTVTSIGEGRHTVAISVGGVRRFEEIVAIRGGEVATLDALLRGQPVPVPAQVPAASASVSLGMIGASPVEPARAAAPRPEVPEAPGAPRPSPLWKVSLVAGAAIAVAGGAFAWYSYDRQQAQSAHIHAMVGNERCGDSDPSFTSVPGIDLHAFHRACTWHTRTYEGYAVAGLGAVAAVVSLIMMSRDAGHPDRAALHVGRRSEIAIAPIVAPGLAGARVALAW